MSGSPALVYLEADDEITSVVRRVRSADADRVVVVAPGRSRATSSAIALRLLARAGDEEGREVVVVGDPLTRSLAAEAGLPAFASIDDARVASLDAADQPSPDVPRHAAIHVVRGGASDETVATPAAVAPGLATAVPTPRSAGPSDETITVPVPRRERPRAASRPRAWHRGSRGLATVLAVAAALLIAGAVAGATLLPAATITVAPRPVSVTGTYELVVEEPVRREGTVEATTTVTASGTYETREEAQGAVIFLNWTFFPVDVPAGTFVAAGEQAFATQADITVPRGRLTAEGTIAAGEQSVAVVAAAAGPAANVDAGAINTIVDEQIDDRLGGVPENPQPRVTNPEPTTGGLDETGAEITQEDVDAAVEELRMNLRRLADETRPDVGALRVLEETAEDPRIDVPEGLVGMRDAPETEIAGSLTWSLVAVDLEPLEENAAGRLASDPSLPEGHDVVEDSIRVELGDPMMDGETVSVEATVEGTTVPRIDLEAVRDRVIGLTAEEVRLALADLGEVQVVLWPDWVESVPELDWRVDVRVKEATP